ncbi:ABC transporter ATP-binding protein [Grimontia kaedaensis]|uniref:ABC-type dipeptide transporter n=1 Tax=Grimontia kaedaensis TaxID=2872157 RepID=A0ABY4WNR9_9GAMM|nr:ABC transporter ATP-binding protein [Grimontia kaedaensis]USH01211.1 ABC transporter ATP-binding protein [Grimontia kaedaensis]
MDQTILDVRQLRVAFKGYPAVNDISFHIKKGEILGVVGESGCGKSLAALTLMGLQPKVMKASGQVVFNGENILANKEADWQQVRGEGIAMIFQEPMTALNPVVTVGDQIAEMFELHRGSNKVEAQERAIEMLEKVHIPDPVRRAKAYPHELSGGMRQRVMIAMALACEPELIIADEPTTALDVTVQAQVLDLLEELRDTTGTAVQFISHNLGVVSQLAERVIVMYAGRIVEQATAEELFANPQHPYTQGLLATLPRIGGVRDVLPAIPGAVPPLDQRGQGCPFADRCGKATPTCIATMPEEVELNAVHTVACHHI